ncbi:MAG: fumarylacetoacetate hydrolase family protein [Ilumatobacter sp.]
MKFAVDAPTVVTLPVSGTDLVFPVNRVFCVGRNYADHAIEMGHDPDREDPFFFVKTPDTVVAPGAPFPYPPVSSDVHHECELVVALGRGGSEVPVADALDLVYGYGVGLDMTRRDLQSEAKRMGRPWATAKSFAASAPMSALTTVADIGHPDAGEVVLAVDGRVRQHGDLSQQIWKPAEIIAALSRLFALTPGDLIMTGTPAGVGPIERGQTMRGYIAGVGELIVDVV